MRISDWSSDVCSSDLLSGRSGYCRQPFLCLASLSVAIGIGYADGTKRRNLQGLHRFGFRVLHMIIAHQMKSAVNNKVRSEEHTSELQSLMRISYAVFCLKKKKTKQHK